MAEVREESVAVLPAAFIRGLEGDLRALCADSKRNNPCLKDIAERVILQLKEADTPSASAEAASAAAEAFCTAATPGDSGAAASSIATHNRVVLRAVSCLHKLLTHRAVAVSRLPAVIDALERLAVNPASDDPVTLKVLQALLSILTVKMYVCGLPEQQLSRAFSMLFKLRTRSSSAAVAAASGPLSAISAVAVPKVEPDEFGVIEVTAHAAFRQSASDLFAAACAALVDDSTVYESVASLPPIVGAAFALFQDMCSVIAGDNLKWLSLGDRHVQPVLALEVMDDGLAGNIALFRAARSPVFSSLLSSRLCPAIHEMLRSDVNRHVYKALFAVTVTMISHLWADLGPDSEVLLCCIVKLIELDDKSVTPPWSTVYAIEALRAIFQEGGAETPIAQKEGGREPIFVSLFNVFDVQSASSKASGGEVMTNMLHAVCRSGLALVQSGKADIALLPVAPLVGTAKPFSTSDGNRFNIYVASAASLCLSYCNALEFVSTSTGSEKVAVAMVGVESAKLVTSFLSSLFPSVPLSLASHRSIPSSGASETPLQFLIGCLTRLLVAADQVNSDEARAAVISSLATQAAAALAAARNSSLADQDIDATRAIALYEGLFHAEKVCGERFGPAWREFVGAAHTLDVTLHGEASVLSESESSSLSTPRSPVVSALSKLKPGLEGAFAHASKLSWSACNDLISALVVSSRSSLAAIAKSPGAEDASSSKPAAEFRVFGIARAESVMTGIFSPESNAGTDSMPHGLWQLLTGHLVAIGSDSATPGMRITAIRSLLRVSACALESKVSHLLPQSSVIAPISDLLASAHSDTREGCLDAVYSLLETRGEFIKDSGAWDGILSILLSASGDLGRSKTGDSGGTYPASSPPASTSTPGNAARVVHTSTGGVDPERAGEAMVQRGFRVVQLVADDFIPFLAFDTLSKWISLLRQYGQQAADVNVALTAVGLVWRTADHFAKHCGERVYDTLWMELFEVLKAIGSDERPEVRNGAVKTLTGTLSAHGSKLTASAWRGCVERALLPLLEEVMQGGGADGRDSLQAKSKADAQLVLHHSRDTPRKQWNETRVLALGGVASVLRKAIPDMAGLQDENGRPLFMMLADGGSEGLWAKMLRAAGSAASSSEKEVAMGGVGALLELLSASGSVKAETIASSGSVALWDEVWVAIDEAVSGEEADSGKMPGISSEKALVTLAKGLGDAREDLSDAFTVKSSVLFLSILGRLVLGDSSVEHDARGSLFSARRKRAVSTVTEVQGTAVHVIENMTFGDDSTTWTALVGQLLVMIEGRPVGESDALSQRLILLVESLYEEDRLPATVKTAQLHNVIGTLGTVMCQNSRACHTVQSPVSVGAEDQTVTSVNSATDGSPFCPAQTVIEDHPAAGENGDTRPLWVVAVRAFASILRSGLRAGTPTMELGSTLRDVAFKFLYTTSVRPTAEALVDPSALQERALAEMHDIAVAQCVREALVVMSGSVDNAIQKELLDVLAHGAEEGMRGGRPKFVRSCQGCMFALADDSSKVEANIAEQAAACVVRISDSVLGRFVADGQRAGKCPLPSERRAEVVFLLRRLQALRLSSGSEGPRQHLRILHPRLCECSDGSDAAVKLLAQMTIQSAG